FSSSCIFFLFSKDASLFTIYSIIPMNFFKSRSFGIFMLFISWREQLGDEGENEPNYSFYPLPTFGGENPN
ncbi:MAG: hypothetical protein LBI29_00975, partial [Rickettsiales bacterium]|nr:hypothetical protein [Rickettsiales bacterium]